MAFLLRQAFAFVTWPPKHMEAWRELRGGHRVDGSSVYTTERVVAGVSVLFVGMLDFVVFIAIQSTSRLPGDKL